MISSKDPAELRCQSQKWRGCSTGWRCSWALFHAYEMYNKLLCLGSLLSQATANSGTNHQTFRPSDLQTFNKSLLGPSLFAFHSPNERHLSVVQAPRGRMAAGCLVAQGQATCREMWLRIQQPTCCFVFVVFVGVYCTYMYSICIHVYIEFNTCR